jgi:hypothetical protein
MADQIQAPSITPESAAPAPIQQEAPKAAQQAPTESDADYVQRLAHITKRERALVEKQKQLAEVETQAQVLSKAKQAVQAGDIGAAYSLLSDIGVSFEQLTDYILDQNKPEEKRFRQMQQEIEALKQERAQEHVLAQQKHIESVNAQYKQTIAAIAESNADSYELSRDTYGDGLADAAFDLIVQDWERRGSPVDASGRPAAMSQKQALDMIEDYLTQESERAFTQMKSRKKFQHLFGQQSPVDAQPKAPGQQVTLSAMPTVVGANAAAPTTAAERMNAAINLLKQGK